MGDEQAIPPARDSQFRTTRRGFLKGVGLAAGATMLPRLAEGQGATTTTDPGFREMGRAPQPIELRINGTARTITVEPRTTLLTALREQLGLTGCKEICDRGSCGGCSVLINGESVASCMTLAVDCQGAEITTVEGIAKDPRFAPLIDSYIEHDGAQCGFCIPGFVVQSAAVLQGNPTATAEEIRHGLAGNICRCGAYNKIFAAVEAVAKGGSGS